MVRLQHFTLAFLALIAANSLIADAKFMDVHSQEFSNIKQQYLNLFQRDASSTNKQHDFHIDTSDISSLVSHTTLFSSMIPKHKQAVNKIVQILKSQPTIEKSLQVAEYLRDRPEINLKAWYYAVTAWTVTDPRLQALPKPSPVDVMPDRFINAQAMEKAEEMRQLKKNGIKADECVIIDEGVGVDNGAEHALWYFREDLMNNAFHYFYHVYYYNHVDTKPDRRSETFYFLHRDVIARYDAERISNRLPRTKSLQWGPGTLVEEQFYPHLNDSMTRMSWGGRDANVSLPDINLGGAITTLAETVILERRVYEATKTGFLRLANGSMLPIDNRDGTEYLGDIIEGNEFSLNPEYYEFAINLHGSIHVAIGQTERPADEPQIPAGVMLDIAVSFRDPTFYRWHLYVNDLFDSNKQRLRPYTPTGGELPLAWNGVTVTEVGVQRQAGEEPTNQLFTFFGERRFELRRGLDHLGDFDEPIDVCVKHINHEDFVYKVVVNSDNFFTRTATVRLFLVPRGDENDRRFTMREQRDLIFTLDVFQTTLQPGENVIYRASNMSSVTAPWTQTLDELTNGNETTTACGCGYPHHMQLPKGRAEGMVFDLVALVTNFVDDAVPYDEPLCRAAYVLCGLPHTNYPDAKPMAYPFDRLPYHVDANGNPTESGTPVRDLDEYVRHVPNMATSQVTITHMGDRTGRNSQPRLDH